MDILQKLFGEVLTSETVRDEFGETLPDWIVVKKVELPQIEKILRLNVDEGEASAMALCIWGKPKTLCSL